MEKSYISESDKLDKNYEMTTHSPPGHPQVVLGISDSITSGAALVVDGRIVAAVNEERLNRMKMSTGWPRLAISEVLRIAGVEVQEVEAVAVATQNLFWHPIAAPMNGYFEGKTWSLDKKLMMGLGSAGASIFGNVPSVRIPYYRLKSLFCLRRRIAVRGELAKLGIQAPHSYVDHHLAHAASAYFTGGKTDATIVTLDGAGDNISATVYLGCKGELHRITAVSSYDSIGNFYSYVTHILGFSAHKHEGKITGLAAFGEPVHADIFRRLVRYQHGRIENRSCSFHLSAIRKLRQLLPPDADRADVAASIQLVLEEICGALVSHWANKLGAQHLGLAGGVPANVKLNQRLLELDCVPSIFIHPGMGDDGLAVGAALQVHAASLPAHRRMEAVYQLPHVYLGPSYDEVQMGQALDEGGFEYCRPVHLAAEIATLIADGNVVARFNGAMEYGPRALGNRSILVHAGDPSINDWLNQRLKRTEFMPFAPVTLAEDAEQFYSGLNGAEHTAQFMTITCDGTRRLKELCPAVVHVDGTARPQLVDVDANASLRAILEAYKAQCGFSTIINTSFNMHEEPIVCTPKDAVRAFADGEMDYLVLGDYLAAHPHRRTKQDTAHAYGGRSQSPGGG